MIDDVNVVLVLVQVLLVVIIIVDLEHLLLLLLVIIIIDHRQTTRVLLIPIHRLMPMMTMKKQREFSRRFNEVCKTKFPWNEQRHYFHHCCTFLSVEILLWTKKKHEHPFDHHQISSSLVLFDYLFQKKKLKTNNQPKIEFDFEIRLTYYLFIWLGIALLAIFLAWYRYGASISQQLSKTRTYILIELFKKRIIEVRDRVSAQFDIIFRCVESKISREKSSVEFHFERIFDEPFKSLIRYKEFSRIVPKIIFTFSFQS